MTRWFCYVVLFLTTAAWAQPAAPTTRPLDAAAIVVANAFFDALRAADVDAALKCVAPANDDPDNAEARDSIGHAIAAFHGGMVLKVVGGVASGDVAVVELVVDESAEKVSGETTHGPMIRRNGAWKVMLLSAERYGLSTDELRVMQSLDAPKRVERLFPTEARDVAQKFLDAVRRGDVEAAMKCVLSAADDPGDKEARESLAEAIEMSKAGATARITGGEAIGDVARVHLMAKEAANEPEDTATGAMAKRAGVWKMLLLDPERYGLSGEEIESLDELEFHLSELLPPQPPTSAPSR